MIKTVNILDVIILLVVMVEAFIWARRGLVSGLFSLGGFWLGLLAGALVVPVVLGIASGEISKLMLAVAVVIGMAFVGEAIGRATSRRISGFRKRVHIQRVDGVAGAAFAACMTLIVSWLLAAALIGSPVRALNTQIRDSSIITALNKSLPPAPEILSRISSLVSETIFPDVFIGGGPRPVEPVQPPTSGEVAQAFKNAGKSTVRVEGFGCGGLKTGSGFVASDGLVITNAHVVSGLSRPTVVDANGKHAATPVVFDPDLDVAVLRTSNLAGPALPLAPKEYPRGTKATILGYPGGGSLEADAAGIMRSLEARGRDIYGHGIAIRSVYELQTRIEQGNSGGPLVLSNGTVVGVIFARSQTEASIGYALTSPQLFTLLETASNTSQAVGTSTCSQ